MGCSAVSGYVGNAGRGMVAGAMPSLVDCRAVGLLGEHVDGWQAGGIVVGVCRCGCTDKGDLTFVGGLPQGIKMAPIALYTWGFQ